MTAERRATEAEHAGRLESVLRRVPGIDLYLTYRCDMRCNHCFVGPLLGSTDMPWPLVVKLIDACGQFGVGEITFLGGEPTTHPRIAEAIEMCHERGLAVRIVSNGVGRLAECLERQWDGPLHVCLSIDGGGDGVHDAIRRGGSFAAMLANARLCAERGIPISSITSISRENRADLRDILETARSIGAEHINLHYVSARGFAKGESTLDPEEWVAMEEEVRALSEEKGMKVRFERTFTTSDTPVDCLVRTGKNAMFFPDGRVFHCALFIDHPEAHSYKLTETGLVANQNPRSESAIANAHVGSNGCPAADLIYGKAQLDGAGHCYHCIYSKTLYDRGVEAEDFRGHA